MFAKRYFPDRYYTPRYFPKVGVLTEEGEGSSEIIVRYISLIQAVTLTDTVSVGIVRGCSVIDNLSLLDDVEAGMLLNTTEHTLVLVDTASIHRISHIDLTNFLILDHGVEEFGMANITEGNDNLSVVGIGTQDILLPIKDKVYDVSIAARYNSLYAGPLPQVLLLNKGGNVIETATMTLGHDLWEEIKFENLRDVHYLRLKSNTTNESAEVLFSLPVVTWSEKTPEIVKRFHRPSLQIASGL